MKKTVTVIPFLGAIVLSSTASAAVVVYQDEAAFTADLVNPADFGSVQADPFGTSDTTGNTSLSWTSEINGKNYSITFSEGLFDTSLGGTASEATAAPTVGDIDTSDSSFVYEAGTLDQGGASIPTWGFDSGSTASNASNSVALFDFTSSETDVYAFSLKAVDFEGGNAWSSVVAAYRPDGSLIDEVSFDWPAPDYGDGTVEYIGFGADEAIGYVAFFVGEDDATGYGHGERVAVGDFKLGTSALGATVPEPSTVLSGGLGLFVALLRRRRG